MQDPIDRGVHQTLPGHDGLTTGVRFVRDVTLVTADDKGSLRSWEFLDGKAGKITYTSAPVLMENFQWTHKHTVSAHKSAISSLAVYGTYIVSGASDSQVKVWELTDGLTILLRLS